MGASIPPGSSRSFGYQQNDENATGDGGTFRGGTANALNARPAFSTTGPDGVTGIAGAGNGALINAPAGAIGPGQWYRWTGGSGQWVPRVFVHIAQPAIAFNWFIGRVVFELFGHWDVAPGAGIDSGILWAKALNARLLPGSNQLDGIGLFNVAGVLKLVTRGNGRYEEVDLSAYAAPLNEGNKLALHLCNATVSTPARVIAMVNDLPAAVRYWQGAHALPAEGTFNPNITHCAPGTSFFNQTQLAYSQGPDTDDL
jgi:hypothetical protein